ESGSPVFATRGPDGVVVHVGSRTSGPHRDLALLRTELGGRRWVAAVLDEQGWGLLTGGPAVVDPPAAAWTGATAIGEPTFSADGKNLAVAVARTAEEGDDDAPRWSVVVDGVAVWTGTGRVGHDTVRLAPDGR